MTGPVGPRPAIRERPALCPSGSMVHVPASNPARHAEVLAVCAAGVTVVLLGLRLRVHPRCGGRVLAGAVALGRLPAGALTEGRGGSAGPGPGLGVSAPNRPGTRRGPARRGPGLGPSTPGRTEPGFSVSPARTGPGPRPSTPGGDRGSA
ncbi:hypothetical protein GCM10010340_54240 [Streptomyces griseoloalbus]|nr:hypothetical protein GCM10010340_54240 [Streptomyces albaduncus]